jgi:hypothetical protein
MKPGTENIKKQIGEIAYRYMASLPYYGDAGQGWPFWPYHMALGTPKEDSGRQHVISKPEQPAYVLPNGDLLGFWINHTNQKKGVEMDYRFTPNAQVNYLTWVDKGNMIFMVYHKFEAESSPRWRALSQVNTRQNIQHLFYGYSTTIDYQKTPEPQYAESSSTDEIPTWIILTSIAAAIVLTGIGIKLLNNE